MAFSSAASFSCSSTLSMKKTCFYCKAPSALLKPGWLLSSGGSALLCDRCASAYEEGRFCDIFLLDDNGWRDCITCKKYVHCGCIMSARTYILMDVGDGIRCTECISNDILVGTKSFKISTKNSLRRTRQNMQGSMEIAPSVDSDKNITETTPGAPSQKDAPPKSRDSSPSGSSKGNKQSQTDASQKVHTLRRYTLQATEQELQQIQKDANSVVVPLFEKIMTVSDADPKNGRLVVPKRCATDYLPKLSDPQGFLIRMQDTSGKDWDFHFRFWPNNNSIMYVLEGLKDYLISN